MAIQSLDRDASSNESALATVTKAEMSPGGERFIRYGGRTFCCSIEMAEIFLRHAQELIETGQEQLVPLRHAEGVDLLLITRSTPYSIVKNRVT